MTFLEGEIGFATIINYSYTFNKYELLTPDLENFEPNVGTVCCIISHTHWQLYRTDLTE